MKLGRGFSFLLLVATLSWAIQAKVYENDITFAAFRRSGGWVFLTKMGLEQGEMQATFESKIQGVPFATLEPIELAVVTEDNWQQHLDRKCEANTTVFHTAHQLRADGVPVVNTFSLSIPSDQTYYFLIRDCTNALSRQHSNTNLHLIMKLTILNNQSHLSDDEDDWLIFPLMFAIGVWLVMRNRKDNIWGEDFDWAKFLLLAAVGTNLSALFWKAVGFLIYATNGHDYAIFDIFYLGLHSISQTVVICLMVMIAYGWTINYLTGEDFDLYIPLMTMLGLLNTIVTILNKINDHDHDKYHMYDSVPSYLLIGFRCIIMLIYVIGIIITYRSSIPKKRPFIVQFGVLGLVYVMSLPLLIFITEYFVSQRHQKQFLFLSVQSLKTLSTILLTYMITSKKSSYAKVCYRSLSFLPQNEKFF